MVNGLIEINPAMRSASPDDRAEDRGEATGLRIGCFAVTRIKPEERSPRPPVVASCPMTETAPWPSSSA